jgi:uncharacterized OB-fold protein
MNAPVPRLIPRLDEVNRDFWTGGSSGELRIQRCTACSQWVFPPSAACPACGGPAEYQAVSGKGRVFSYTVNHQPYNPAVPVPYVIAIVELPDQDGVRFTTNIVNCPPEEVRIGMPVHVLFEEQDGVYVPVFEPD